MSARVVDCLEVVQIEVEQGNVAHPFVLIQRSTQAFVKEIAISEPGQIVVMRHEGDALFDHPIARHIPCDAADLPIVTRPGGELPVAHLPVDPQFEHQIVEAAAFSEMPRKNGAVRIRHEHVDQRLSFERFGRLLGCHCEPLSYVTEIAGFVDRPEPVGRMLFVIVEQQANRVGSFTAIHLGFEPLDNLPLLLARRAEQRDDEKGEQDQGRQTRHTSAGPDGSGD